jgi:dephospho-CoA kinase
MPQRVIGLCGLSCSGKNYVASIISGFGYPVLDLDVTAHEALENKAAVVKAAFGVTDRREIGRIVFANTRKLEELEAIVHPETDRLVRQWLEDQNGGRRADCCFLNAAVLHKSSLFQELNGLIVVRAPFLTRLFRARRRDGLPFGQLIKRLRSQSAFLAKYFQANTDIYSIYNGVFSFCLKKRVRRLIETVINRGY